MANLPDKTSKPKTKGKSKTETSKVKPKATSKSKAVTKAKAKDEVKPKSRKAKKTTPSKSKAKPKVKPKTRTKKAVTPAKKTKKKRKAKPPVEVKSKPSRPRRAPLEKPIKGVLMNFQRGTVRQRQQYGLVQLEGISTISAAASFIGRSVILHFNERTKNYGRVISVHGRNGVLRVRFRRSLAADALAKEVLVF